MATIHVFQNAPFTKSVEKITSTAPMNTLSATINWGDNTSSAGTLQAIGVDRYSVNGTHTYGTAGTFPVVITVSENNVPLPPRNATAVVAADNIILDGTLSGTYVFAAPLPTSNAGPSYQFDGTGTLQRLGHVKAEGTVVLPGNTPGQNPTGTMTFIVPTGTVSIQFTGQALGPNLPFPGSIRYAVTGGTGSWVASRGHGTVTATLNADGTFSFVFAAM